MHLRLPDHHFSHHNSKSRFCRNTVSWAPDNPIYPQVWRTRWHPPSNSLNIPLFIWKEARSWCLLDPNSMNSGKRNSAFQKLHANYLDNSSGVPGITQPPVIRPGVKWIWTDRGPVKPIATARYFHQVAKPYFRPLRIHAMNLNKLRQVPLTNAKQVLEGKPDRRVLPTHHLPPRNGNITSS